MPPANSSAVARSWISLALKRCICTRQAPAAGCSWLPAVSALPAPGRARQHAVPPAAKRCVQLPLGGSLCVSAGMPANASVLGGSVVPWIPLLDRHTQITAPLYGQRWPNEGQSARTPVEQAPQSALHTRLSVAASAHRLIGRGCLPTAWIQQSRSSPQPGTPPGMEGWGLFYCGSQRGAGL